MQVVFDDLIIGLNADGRHDGLLKQVLGCARANNVKFNPGQPQSHVDSLRLKKIFADFLGSVKLLGEFTFVFNL